MDLRDFYFQQPVTEEELNGAFTAVQQAMWNLMTDQHLYGIFQNGVGSQHSPVPALSVDVSGPLYAYDNSGERISFSPSVVTVDVSTDSNEVNTAVAGVSNEKYLSVFVKFARTLSDPRIDGNSETVYFQEDESYTVEIVQGAEAAVGTAPLPSLDPTALLLFDVHLVYGQTQVMNGDISTTRRQDTIVVNQTPASIRAGTTQGAVVAMLTALNAHINGSEYPHPATAVTTTASPEWADSTSIASGDVQGYLDAIVNDLTASADAKLGASIAHSGSPFSLSTGTIGSQMQQLLGGLNDIVSTIGEAGGIAGLDGSARIAVGVPRNGVILFDQVADADCTSRNVAAGLGFGQIVELSLSFPSAQVGDVVDVSYTFNVTVDTAESSDLQALESVLYVSQNGGGGVYMPGTSSFSKTTGVSGDVLTMGARAQFTVTEAGNLAFCVYATAPGGSGFTVYATGGYQNNSICGVQYRP